MRKTLLIVLSTVCLFVFSAVVSQAAEIMIPGTAFKPYDETVQFVIANSEVYVKSGSSQRSMYAPVFGLPHNERVHKVVVYFSRYVTTNVSVYLKRKNMYTRTVQTMATITIAGPMGDGYSYTSTIYTPVISNSGYGYYIYVNFPSGAGTNFKIHGVKIVTKTSS
ncbi:MAG: hypothetical protein ACE5WD_07680 [Candidatus Aminicenantia bacterium]